MKPFEHIVGKGENAGNQQFLLFPHCYLAFPKQISLLKSHLFCRLQMLPILICPKFCDLIKRVKSFADYKLSMTQKIKICV